MKKYCDCEVGKCEEREAERCASLHAPERPKKVCSFCFNEEPDVKLIRGPLLGRAGRQLRLCDQCTKIATEYFNRQSAKES